MTVDLNVVSPTRTICEVLREINDLAIERNMPDISLLVIEAITMGKKMSEKLIEYKEQSQVYKDLDAAPNQNFELSKERRKSGH